MTEKKCLIDQIVYLDPQMLQIKREEWTRNQTLPLNDREYEPQEFIDCLKCRIRMTRVIEWNFMEPYGSGIEVTQQFILTRTSNYDWCQGSQSRSR